MAIGDLAIDLRKPCFYIEKVREEERGCNCNSNHCNNKHFVLYSDIRMRGSVTYVYD